MTAASFEPTPPVGQGPTVQLPRQPGWRLSLTILLLTVYSAVFIMRPPVSLPADVRSAWREPARVVRAAMDRAIPLVGLESLNRDVRNVAYLVLVSGVIPLAGVLLMRRSLCDVGTRIPNRYGLRLVVISVILALPFLIWMVNSPGIAKPYVDEWKRNTPLVFLACYFFNMLTEHFLIQGVILGLCHTSGRWPTIEQDRLAGSLRNNNLASRGSACNRPIDEAGSIVGGSVSPVGPVFNRSMDESESRPALLQQASTRDTVGSFRRLLRWFGLDGPVDRSRPVPAAVQWFGLPSGCLAAIVTSALVFGLIHLGKDFRECLLSFPGGLALAYIAYRTDSWLTPFIIHACTAGLAFLMMYLRMA